MTALQLVSRLPEHHDRRRMLREGDAHARPLPWRTVDCEGATDPRGALGHRRQTKVTGM
jgi:hypothetical protein